MANDIEIWKNPSALPITEDDAAANAELDAALGNLNVSINDGGGAFNGLPFLGIDHEGIWNYGAEDTEVQPGSVLAVDVGSLKTGWSVFENGKSAGKQMLSIAAGHIPLSAMPPGKDWKATYEANMLFLNGEDQGKLVLYSTNSGGGRTAMEELRVAIKRQAAKGDPRRIPCVELHVHSYFHKKFNKTIFNPILKVVGWLDRPTFARMTESAPAALPPADEPEPTSPMPSAPAAAERRRGRPPAAAAPVHEPEVRRRRRAVGDTA